MGFHPQDFPVILVEKLYIGVNGIRPPDFLAIHLGSCTLRLMVNDTYRSVNILPAPLRKLPPQAGKEVYYRYAENVEK